MDALLLQTPAQLPLHLKALRKRRGLTQAQVASRLGIKQARYAFIETHPDPANARSDGPNAWPLDRMESLLTTLVELDRLVKQRGFEES